MSLSVVMKGRWPGGVHLHAVQQQRREGAEEGGEDDDGEQGDADREAERLGAADGEVVDRISAPQTSVEQRHGELLHQACHDAAGGDGWLARPAR